MCAGHDDRNETRTGGEAASVDVESPRTTMRAVGRSPAADLIEGCPNSWWWRLLIVLGHLPQLRKLKSTNPRTCTDYIIYIYLFYIGHIGIYPSKPAMDGFVGDTSTSHGGGLSASMVTSKRGQRNVSSG